MIPLFRPDLRPADFAHVREILRTGWIAPGRFSKKLEENVAKSLGKRPATACASGMTALNLSLRALGVKAGDRVLIPSYTCAAVLQAVRHAGAEPDLMDCDPGTLNPSPDDARKARTPKTRAVVLVHASGHPSRVSDFRFLGVPIIEDCALAAGAEIDDKPVGSFGDAAVFSFHATKPVCAGAGGLACAKDAKTAAILKDLTRYDMREDSKLRFSASMSDLTAGLALSQWRRLRSFVQKRRALASLYRQELGASLVEPIDVRGAKPSYHHFLLNVKDAARFIATCRRAGVSCDRPVYKPLHRYLGLRRPGAEKAWRRWAMLPLYPAMTDAQARAVPRLVRPILERSV